MPPPLLRMLHQLQLLPLQQMLALLQLLGLLELKLMLAAGQQHAASSDALRGHRGLCGHDLRDRGRGPHGHAAARPATPAINQGCREAAINQATLLANYMDSADVVDFVDFLNSADLLDFMDSAATLSVDIEDVGHAEDSADSMEQWTPRRGIALKLAAELEA